MRAAIFTPVRPSEACLARLSDDGGLPIPLVGRLSRLIFSRPRRCSLSLRPAWPADPQKGPFPEVLQTIRRLLIRPGCFRLERELPGGVCTHVIGAPWQGTQWNAIEHRLFSFISMNWRATPLVSYRVIVDLIGATTTTTGLTVHCELDASHYPKGIAVSDEPMASLNISRHDFHGEWNYTIRPGNKSDRAVIR
jgi:hypothetical protein